MISWMCPRVYNPANISRPLLSPWLLFFSPPPTRSLDLISGAFSLYPRLAPLSLSFSIVIRLFLRLNETHIEFSGRIGRNSLVCLFDRARATTGEFRAPASRRFSVSYCFQWGGENRAAKWIAGVLSLALNMSEGYCQAIMKIEIFSLSLYWQRLLVV